MCEQVSVKGGSRIKTAVSIVFVSCIYLDKCTSNHTVLSVFSTSSSYSSDTQVTLPGGHFCKVTGGQEPVNKQTFIINIKMISPDLCQEVRVILPLFFLYKQALR